jgi:CheY-like chemotaxis protein
VLIARDGASGVALARAERPDLILMNLGLPIIDGWESSRRLKSDAARSHIRLIAQSARVSSSERTRRWRPVVTSTMSIR